MATVVPDPDVYFEQEPRAQHTERTAKASIAPIGECGCRGHVSLQSICAGQPHARPRVCTVLSTLRAGTGDGRVLTVINRRKLGL